MTAPGFCTCRRDFPARRDLCPPEGATWHYLCDKPVLPPWTREDQAAEDARHAAEQWPPGNGWPRTVPTGTGWPDDDAEAARIAEVFEDARAELDRGL